MGEGLVLQFFAFERLFDPGTLSRLKRDAAEVEQAFSREGGARRVNLDPGYLDFGKVVLASFKWFVQKVYLDDGVYADVVLLYAKVAFQPSAWTFPDFCDGRYGPFLLRLRQRYKGLLKGGG